LSEDKSRKHRWTDPVVLVPIITAIIAAIPTYVLLVRPAIDDTSTPEPTTASTPEPTTASTPDDATGPGGMEISPPDDATETTPEPTPTSTELDGITEYTINKMRMIIEIIANINFIISYHIIILFPSKMRRLTVRLNQQL
jgi:hypothetical protein